MDGLGDRMKTYERIAAGRLMPKVPIVVRVDGRAFHTYTRGMARPFDGYFMDAMQTAACAVAGEMQGFRLAYVQSDEASFYFDDTANLDTQQWFGGEVQKIVSVSAALMTAAFNQAMGGARLSEKGSQLAAFDARAFSLPLDDVPNYFLWRHRDWNRNSLQMYCQYRFPHSALVGVDRAGQHELLHSVGLNWATDLTPRERDGTYVDRNGEFQCLSEPSYRAIAEGLLGWEGER